MSPIKSVAFAHGIWADGSCFAKVMTPLRKDGYEVIASQHALDDFQADVDCTIRTFAQVPSPILLVGHSYGAPSSPWRGTTIGSPVWCSSTRLGPTRLKPCKVSRTSSRRRTCSSQSRWRTDVSGCSQRASSTSGRPARGGAAACLGDRQPPSRNPVRRKD